jgi:hypothetical protein
LKRENVTWQRFKNQRSDERNHHVHILFTSRQLDKDTGEFSKNKFRDFNKEKSSETVTAWRKDFADLANHYLEKNNWNGLKKQKISMKPRLEPQNKLIRPQKQKYIQNHQNLKKII